MHTVLCMLFGLWCTAQAQPELEVKPIILSNGTHTHTIQAEIADEAHERQTGLMYRKNIPIGTGMLFIWEKPMRIGMWMKNTSTPLDMLFFREGKLLGTVENTQPFSLDVVGIAAKSDMVLEIPAGQASVLNIVPTQTSWTLHIAE